MTFRLASPAFGDGQAIPARNTCEGADVSPPLQWSNAPEGTLSFALVCTDPDAPVGTWYHWAVFDIQANTTRLDEAYPADERVGSSRQAVNDFKRTGYGGPCPPQGHGAHHYHFRLIALDVETLALASSPDCREVERAVIGHALAETVLIGTYER